MSKLENMFKETFNNVKKLIRFKPMWLGAEQDFRKIVVDRAHRLMLDVGEVVKIEDKHGNLYLVVGTPFGIVAARRVMMFGKAIIKYETTKNLVKAFSTNVQQEVNFFQAPSGLLGEHGFSYLVGKQFQDDLEVIASEMKNANLPVGDGILPPRVQKERIAVPAETNKEIWDKARAKVKAKQKDRHQKVPKAKVPKPTSKVIARPEEEALLANASQLTPAEKLINAAPLSYELGIKDTSERPAGFKSTKSLERFRIDPGSVPLEVKTAEGGIKKAQPYVTLESA